MRTETANSNARKPSAARLLLRWHRRVGVALSLFFLLVCCTGLLLNHSVRLGLEQSSFQAPWLYRWYGMSPDGPPQTYFVGAHRLSWLDGNLFLEDQLVAPFDEPIGAAALDGFLAAASADRLILLAPTGEIVEDLGPAALPQTPLLRLASLEGRARLAILAESGAFTSDSSFLEWQPSAAKSKSWSAPQPTPPELEERLLAAYRGESLTLYRVILDLHTGAFFGAWGRVIADLSALGLIMLTLTGLYYALKLRRTQRVERPFR